MNSWQCANFAAAQLGLPVGTPVVAAGADKACEVLGSGCLAPNLGALSFGTTATLNTTQRHYVEAVPLVPPYPAAIPDAWSLEIQVYRGFWLVEWFRREFGAAEAAAALRHPNIIAIHEVGEDDGNHFLAMEYIEGKNFAQLRQIYDAFILAAWFKRKMQDSIFKYYIGHKKLNGIDIHDKDAKQKIYNLYLEAFLYGSGLYFNLRLWKFIFLPDTEEMFVPENSPVQIHFQSHEMGIRF